LKNKLENAISKKTNGGYMTKKEIKSVLMEIVAEIIPDEDLTNLKGDIPIREQVELDSMDFLDIIMELRKRYGIEVPEDDYMQLATIDSSVAYLEPRMKDL
jgi:acyl carrier protein